MKAFHAVRASAGEVATPRPGDEIVSPADIVMDRAFTVHAAPDDVWPWMRQLGKERAGWYLPRSVESLLPRSHRASRVIDVKWQSLTIGDVIPDYGGRNETLEVVEIAEPTSLVYRSRRGRTDLTWSITIEASQPPSPCSRVFLRLRLAPVRHKLLASTAGELIDLLTVAGMAAGLSERLEDRTRRT